MTPPIIPTTPEILSALSNSPALIIAQTLHATQTDKNGQPYIHHVETVANYALSVIRSVIPDRPDLHLAAYETGLLHDSIEDIMVRNNDRTIRPMTITDLRIFKLISPLVPDAVILLTRQETTRNFQSGTQLSSTEQVWRDYESHVAHLSAPDPKVFKDIRKVETHIVACATKFADNMHNSDITRFPIASRFKQTKIDNCAKYTRSAAAIFQSLKKLTHALQQFDGTHDNRTS